MQQNEFMLHYNLQIDIPTVRQAVENRRYYSELDRAASKPGGMTQQEKDEIDTRHFGATEITDETMKAQREKDMKEAGERARRPKS